MMVCDVYGTAENKKDPAACAATVPLGRNNSAASRAAGKEPPETKDTAGTKCHWFVFLNSSPKGEAPRDSWHPPNASNYKACETLTKKILSTHIKYHIINPTIKSSKTFFEMPPFPRRSITNSLAPWLRNLGKASEISSALRAAKVRSRRKLSVVWNVDDS